MKPRFFRAPADYRRWLERHHASARELLVGFHKRGTGRPSITWPESVDQALCFGWIDGVRRRLDASRYTIRFTPRRPRSVWSPVNVRRARDLIRRGLMRPAGLEAFEARDREATSAYENRAQRLAPAYEKRLEGRKRAFAFWNAQPPWYRRTVSFWVMSAKKEETRLKRLATLIEDSANGRRVGLLGRDPKG